MSLGPFCASDCCSRATTQNPAALHSLTIGGRAPIVALVGNPNTGKTSLFNALTGFRRRVANYPGVTVEVARGNVRGAARQIELIDLPGTYSLSAQSPDEMIVSDALVGRLPNTPRPDVILAVADASNLARNLYLVSQVLAFETPVVLAVNMMDVAAARGIGVDCERLSRQIGLPVVPVVATKASTIPALRIVLEAAIGAAAPDIRVDLPEPLRAAASDLCAHLHPAEAIRVLLDVDGFAERRFRQGGGCAARLREARQKLAAAIGHDGSREEVTARYRWVARILDGVLERRQPPGRTWTERLDTVLTHPVAGFTALLGVLFIVFQAIFAWATPLMDGIDAGFTALAGVVGGALPGDSLRSLVVDGVIGGVGGVIVFLPQIVILFALIAILEDCGYMARAAYMVDRLMRGFGLSGRSFIPLLSSFACAVPAIMGTRSIADHRERFVTILIAPFMSCSARLPVYALLIAAFVPAERYAGDWIGLQGLVMFAMYGVGAAVAIPIAWLLRKSAFRGPPTGLLLELPTYQLPRIGAITQRVVEAGRSFLVRAGTVILIVNIVVWALGYYPRGSATAERAAGTGSRETGDPDSASSSANLQNSYLGRLGRAIEPVVAPLGWDWRIGTAVIASFPAREVVIGALGTIFNLDADDGETSDPLRSVLQKATWPDGRPLFTLPAALSLMVFFALCAQCASTLVVIGRETRSWLWPIASFTAMTVIAYGAAWCAAAIAGAAGL